ncbi:MAG: DHH family phosphoesterase [Candidatus Aenigmarchaeota archaeon]|nr:DHH family phosphoesterase [Candidatus Aenigmarchaeota archaeon]MCX8179182.1 DHH family phosphoesterase [Candidatus Aenigmarchaeota archaeon]
MNEIKNIEDLVSFLKKVVENVKSGDRVCVVHHDDADGCTSAALMSILLFKNTGQLPEILPIRSPTCISKNFINRLKSTNPDYIFTLDVSIDPKKMGLFNGFILDHHIQNYQNKGNMLYLNPRFFEKVDENVPPTSFIIYKLFKSFYPFEKISWIAAIGITEDHRVELCKEVFYQVMKEYPNFFDVNEINQRNIENSVFGKLWDMVRAGRMIKRIEGAKIAVRALIECKDNPSNLLEGSGSYSYNLLKFYKNVDREVKKILKNIPKNTKFYKEKKVLVYNLPASKMESLTSFIADKLRSLYPEWIVCVVGNAENDKGVKISIRVEQNKRDVDLAFIVEKLKVMFNGLKGGGHKSAVGVNIKKDDVEKFFKELLNSV